MSKKIIIITSILFSILTYAQNEKGIVYGISGGLQYNSAILPDVELNESIESVLAGDDVIKGTPQLADFKLNFKIGGFAKYEDGFGFTKLEVNYTPTNIYKEFKINTGTELFPDITYSKIDENYSYLDIALSYNVYLYKKVFFSLGASPSFLLSNTGSINPQKFDFRIFTGFGVKLDDKISVNMHAEVGINEVYKDSYIHHIMIPVGIAITL
jgi:hypothetical protein